MHHFHRVEEITRENTNQHEQTISLTNFNHQKNKRTTIYTKMITSRKKRTQKTSVDYKMVANAKQKQLIGKQTEE